MAITDIHSIRSTPQQCLAYCCRDKTEVYDADKEINETVCCIIDEKKQTVTFPTLTAFQNCDIKNPYQNFEAQQKQWQNKKYKNNGIKTKDGKEPLMYHLYQSFDGFEVSPATANEIGQKLAAELFGNYIVAISTHTNTDNIHNHFVISAWDENGKKLNDCLALKRNIRKVSDRLCEEYGLSVLRETQKMNVIKYKDKDGVTRFYEPTERKNNLINKRQNGEISTDDVNSYRNTISYVKSENIKQTNRDEIKADIDMLLPACRNYAELIERLRDLGYTVKDKKKNGEWLAHISFCAPTQNKATRDDKLGDFYTRENLIKYFAEKTKDFVSEHTEENKNSIENIPYFAEYEYGKTDLNKINENYKTVLSDDGNYKTVERTQTEKKVISDIKKTDIEVKGFVDTSQLERLIEMQRRQKQQRKPYLKQTKEQQLVAKIQSSFQCLQYSEKHNIYSYKQIIDLYTANKTKYDMAIGSFATAENAIKQVKDALTVPQKLTDLLNKIESRKNDIDYILEELPSDKKTVEKYNDILKKYKIDTPQGREQLERKVAEWEATQNRYRASMESIKNTMSELENCIRTFDRIDTEHGCRDELAMRDFERIALKEKQEQKKETRKKEIER